MSLDNLEVETPRLILRPTRWEDFESWAAFMRDAEATRFLGGVQLRLTPWRAMMLMAGAWYLRQPSMFSAIGRRRGQN
jgi:RimJ/RimL family protein N-acetyltransferase